MAWNLLETGGKLVGWKVGATNAPARKQRGIAEPFRGPIFQM